ncbi:hypothetical protein Pan97_32800 [Bremerella volcania]|uniref:HAMP domain-containing protein n=1 Tax=Bremerella volcania TaxID=2527984 RepID=A0A518CAI4_9BACT|nr:hypothetical protein [Bremerella volcania]QDU76235.1 hypothetical protein Pan97_32800 [Bremerella volcania]
MSKREKHERRRLFWVDPKLQGGLVLRAVMHWGICLLSVGTVLVVGAAFSDLHAPVSAVMRMVFDYFVPAVLVSLLVLPIIVLDTIRHSNRLVGSVARFRNAMQRLADGETTSPLIVRDGDCWKTLADQFNRIALRLEELETASSTSQKKTSSCHQEEVVST